MFEMSNKTLGRLTSLVMGFHLVPYLTITFTQLVMKGGITRAHLLTLLQGCIGELWCSLIRLA